jgi:hypothetical protein
MEVSSFAKSIAVFCSKDKNFFLPENKFKASTELELLKKRLDWYFDNMEGDIKSEAPMYYTQTYKEVMHIFKGAISKTKIK